MGYKSTRQWRMKWKLPFRTPEALRAHALRAFLKDHTTVDGGNLASP